MAGYHEFDDVNCAKGPFSPMILEILKYASIMNATCVKLDNDMESTGTCDKSFNCTGYIGKLNDLGLDMISLKSSINHLHYESEEPPVRLSTINQEYSSAMLSEVGPVEADELVVPVNVMIVAYKMFSKELIFFNLLWTLLAYILGKTLIKTSSNKAQRFIIPSYGWNLVQIIFYRLNYRPNCYSLNQIYLIFTLSYFVTFIFFNCMFNTEHVLKEEGYKIDTLEQLAASNTTACSLKGMNSMDYFDQKKVIYKNILHRHRDAKFGPLIDPYPSEVFRLLNLIHDRVCTFIGIESAIGSIQRVYCIQCESSTSSLKQQSYVSRQSFDTSLQSFYMNRNIRDDFFDRLSNTLQHMFELGVIQHTNDMSIVESTAAFGLPDSVSIRNRISGETVFPDRKQFPLSLNNVKYLLRCTMYTLLVALMTIVLEEIDRLVKCGVKRFKRRTKLKKRMKKERKIKRMRNWLDINLEFSHN